jgi:hypothetical protein
MNGRISVTKGKTLSVTFYTAEEKSLLDRPKYNKLYLRDHRLDIPRGSERIVLIAIYQQPGETTKTKVVWLFAPASVRSR